MFRKLNYYRNYEDLQSELRETKEALARSQAAIYEIEHSKFWKLASVPLKAEETTREYGRRKVWCEGLEVAMKVKGTQGRKRVEWVKPEHPFTAISPEGEVHANHNEAQNIALRRRSSAYRRQQNLYAKRLEGLQRVLDVHRLIHNWTKPHWGLENKSTLAMAMGYFHRPVSVHELLTTQGLHTITC